MSDWSQFITVVKIIGRKNDQLLAHWYTCHHGIIKSHCMTECFYLTCYIHVLLFHPSIISSALCPLVSEGLYYCLFPSVKVSSPSHTYSIHLTLTPNGNLRVSDRPEHSCVWTVGGNQLIWTKPTQTHRQNMQKPHRKAFPPIRQPTMSQLRFWISKLYF